MNSAIFAKLKTIVTQIARQFSLVNETPTTGRPRKISELDAIALALYQHKSTRATKRSVYEDFKDVLKCSYETLVVSMNKTMLVCIRILSIITRGTKQYQHLVKYTDATDLPVGLKKTLTVIRPWQALQR